MKAKRSYLSSLFTSVLAGLTSLFGLGSCKTQKIAEESIGTNERNRMEEKMRLESDSIKQGLDMERIGRVRVLYGVAPVRYIEQEQLEQLNNDSLEAE